MSGRLDLTSLKRFTANLRLLPTVLAQKVAEAAAPVITARAKETFDAGENPYGLTWAPGAEGQRVSLVKSGRLASAIRYVAIGTKLRVALGVAYAKYQIGRRPVFPTQGGALPVEYARELATTTAEVCRDVMGAK